MGQGRGVAAHMNECSGEQGGCLQVFNGVLNGCLVRSDFGVLNLGRGVVGILYVSFFLRGWIHSWAYTWVYIAIYIQPPLRTEIFKKSAFFGRFDTL